MNTKELSYVLQNPTSLNKDQTHALEKLTVAFPYFQAIKALHLKGLKDSDSFKYNNELKTTAAYTTDRSVLFDFITSESFTQQTKEQQPQKQKTDIQVIDAEEVKVLPRMPIDEAIRMKIKEAEDVLDPALFSVRKEDSTIKQIEIAESEQNKEHEEEKTDRTIEELQIDKPLEFDKKETHSFSEWLKLTSLTPINRDLNEQEESTEPEKQKNQSLKQKEKFNLIDEFIANNPKIKPAGKNTTSKNLAKENIVPTNELMTETLARVYLAQKNYKKAIQAYNILILKNPEKSGFFADQIRAIKKLQENK
ncbi:hypothetical protein [Aquimarina algicola]|uniref:Tetratricopeptide repeat protein n=1 Tax=Aquimarina algicola TaxID=2589995 RepID=A0A504JHB3_9FLAO|nr:hypothetical protein [Aquimarina algicola]TPN87188.1 hypothetical protein FHK87_06255 [Aquimarina algicola]